MRKIILILYFLFLCSFPMKSVSQILNCNSKSYYPLDGNAKDLQGGLNGDEYNISYAPDRFGNPNCAARFNGKNSYIVIPTFSGFDYLHSGKSFTISLWVKIDTINGDSNQQRLLCNTRGGDVNGIDLYLNKSNDFEFYIGKNKFPYPVVFGTWSGSFPGINNWFHVAVTYDSTLARGNLKFFINGQFIGDTTKINSHPSGNADSKMYFGSYIGYEDFLNGCLDDIRFYDKALSEQEIQELYMENGWHLVSTPFNDKTIEDLWFFNSQKGWIVGDNGILMYTNNGGQTWKDKNTLNITDHIFSIFFISDQKGWAVGDNGLILCTVDGGNTWIKQNSPINTRWYDVFFLNSNEGWIVGMSGYILYTSDGGQQYQTIYPPTYNTLLSVYFKNQLTGWAVGYFGTYLYTTDGGITWKTEDFGKDIFLSKITFINDKKGVIVGTKGFCRVTFDGGKNWENRNINSDVDFFDVGFANETEGWAVGSGGSIYKTMDFANSWQCELKNITYNLFSVFPINNEVVWAAGNDGVLLKIESDNFVKISEEKIKRNIPNKINLFQNYPNPFNSYTIIQYSLPKKGLINLTIFDVLGRKIRTLINSHQNPGKYKIKWDGNNDSGKSVSSGIYYYQLKYDDKIENKKMILIR